MKYFLFKLVFILYILNINANNIKVNNSSPKEHHLLKNKYRQIDSLVVLFNKEYKAENFEQALQQINQIQNIAQQLNNDSIIAFTNERIGMLQFKIGNYQLASKYFLNAIQYYDSTQNEILLAKTYSNFASVLIRIGNYDEAIKYLLLAKKIIKKVEKNNNKAIAGIDINIGLAYENAGILDSASYFYYQAKNQLSDKDTLFLATLYNNIGEIEFKKKNLNEALNFYKLSNNLFKQINYEIGIGSTLSNIAKAEIEQNNLQQAILHLNKSKQLFERLNALYFLVECEELLSKAYEKLNNHKQALIHLKKYIILNDSLKGSKTLKQIANLKLQYQIQKEQQKRKILEQQNLLKEKEHRLQQIQYYSIIASVLILLTITILIIYNLRGRLARTKLAQQLNEQEQITLQAELNYKQQEIENFASYIQEKNTFLKKLATQISEIINTPENVKVQLKKLLNIINQNLYLDNDRKELELKIDQAHQEFIRRLLKKHPSLTKSDLRLCSLILLKFNTKEIASILNIKPESVKMQKNRLRKKLNLNTGENILNYLLSIN
jgi:tetratricopeptide (TPR) repeat protein